MFRQMSNPRSTPADRSVSIQHHVDVLARELGRSVEVDNAGFDLLSASAQYGSIDDYRVRTIIDRKPPSKPIPWMLDHGIETAHRYVRIHANDELGLMGRICFPIRNDAILLGYLWLIDEPAISEDAIRRVEATVTDLVSLLTQADDLLESRLERNNTAFEQLLNSGSAVGTLESAIADGLLADDGELGAYSFTLLTSDSEQKPNDQQLHRAQQELVNYSFSRPFIFSVKRGRLNLVATIYANDHHHRLAREINSALNRRSIAAASGGYAKVQVPEKTHEALLRAEFSSHITSLLVSDEMCQWEQLGTWKLLYGRPLTHETVGELSEAAVTLLNQTSSELWISVLAYLDAARSIKDARARLMVHRTTLYYRLTRVRALIGDQQLDDGWEALALHTALKLHEALTSTADTQEKGHS